MPYWLPSRLNVFVEQCYCHKTKKLGFNGLASPHEGRVQGGIQLRTVEVVFDQLLFAWLGVNRWTNYTHVLKHSWITVLRKISPLAHTHEPKPFITSYKQVLSTAEHPTYHLKYSVVNHYRNRKWCILMMLQYFVRRKPAFTITTFYSYLVVLVVLLLPEARSQNKSKNGGLTD